MRMMMRVAATVLVLASAARADEPKQKAAPTPAKMGDAKPVFVAPDTLQWGPAPPFLPKGSQLAVMYGDPMKPGTFAMRLKMPDGYKIPPHWHSKDEALTVMQGSLTLYMGDTMTGEAHTMVTGAFHFLPAKMHHAAQAKGETIVQINGIGPFDIHYINPSDNPNPKSASR